MTVRELLARMDSAELSEWLAFDRIEPLPDSYWQAGMIASTVANAMGSGKRQFKPEDFTPRPATRREQTPAEMKAVVQGAFAAFRARAQTERK